MRITEKKYEEALETCRKVVAYTKSEDPHNRKKRFRLMESYPTVEDLIEHDVESRFNEFFLYLLLYREPEFFQSDDEEFKRTRAYLSDLFFRQLEIVD